MADQAIDYAALARQAGAVAPSPDAAAPVTPPAGIDYAALAKQAGAVSSTPAPGPSAGTWEDRGIAGKVWHPAAGGSDRTRVDNSLFGMPPEFAAISGLAIARAVSAPALTAAARAVAGIKATVGQALPAVKYEVTKTTLEKFGVPSSVSIPIAMAISSYKRGGKGEAAAAAAASDVPPPGVERYKPNVSGYEPPPVDSAAPAIVDEVAAARAARPTAPGAPALDGGPTGATKSPQQLLNEEAISRRRAAYQASQAAATPPPPANAPIVAASGKMKLTGPEMVEFTRLQRTGLSLSDAYARLMDMRTLAARLGGATPEQMAADMAHRRYKS